MKTAQPRSVAEGRKTRSARDRTGEERFVGRRGAVLEPTCNVSEVTFSRRVRYFRAVRERGRGGGGGDEPTMRSLVVNTARGSHPSQHVFLHTAAVASPAF